MFDLVNANAEYQSHTKLFLKPTFNPYLDEALKIYLEKNQNLDCFKIGRFVNLESSVAVYCQWLYQYHQLQNDYDNFFELFTTTQIKNIANEKDGLIRDYHKEFYTILWPKVLMIFKQHLELAKIDILNKYPYFDSALNSIDTFIYDFETHNSLSIFKIYPKNSFFIKGKYSLSYLKIGFPIYLGYKQNIIEHKTLNPDNINWQDFNEYLQTMCLIHNIQNDNTILNKTSLNNKSSGEKYEALMNNFEIEKEEKSQILSSFYLKAKADLQNLNLLEKQKTTLDNLLNWCYDFQDSEAI
jgi:hypothetical protein